jgi:hypothetical protein
MRQVRIYKINTEHKRWGFNYDSFKVHAATFKLAMKKAERRLSPSERIESMTLLAATD